MSFTYWRIAEEAAEFHVAICRQIDDARPRLAALDAVAAMLRTAGFSIRVVTEFDADCCTAVIHTNAGRHFAQFCVANGLARDAIDIHYHGDDVTTTHVVTYGRHDVTVVTSSSAPTW